MNGFDFGGERVVPGGEVGFAGPMLIHAGRDHFVFDDADFFHRRRKGADVSVQCMDLPGVGLEA